MFEAIVTLCLAAATGPCRDALLAGYEAQTARLCEDALDQRPPDLDDFVGLEVVGTPRCRPIGDALEVSEIAPDVFVHMGRIAEPTVENRGDVANLGFVIGLDSVAVIDSGAARWIGEALWRRIRAETDLPVRHVILTHMHPDHVLGAAPLAETGATVVGHEALSRALADRRANYIESLDRLIGSENLLGTQVADVAVAVADGLVIDLGGRMLELRAWPTAHTGSDLTVLDRVSGTFFAGDLIFDEHAPALDGRLLGWRAVLDELSGMKIRHLVPGHGGPSLDWPEGAADTVRYLEVLEADTRAAISAGLRLGDAVRVIAQGEAGRWDLFDAYNSRNATVAFTELEWE